MGAQCESLQHDDESMPILSSLSFAREALSDRPRDDPPPPYGQTDGPPPSYELAVRGMIRANPVDSGRVQDPHGFGKLPSFQDDRYTDLAPEILYPRWRGEPRLAGGLANVPLDDMMWRIDTGFGSSSSWTPTAALRALETLAEHIAIAPKPRVPMIHLLHHPRVRAVMADWLADPSPLREDTRMRCRAIAVEYLRLLASAVSLRELDAREVVNELASDDLPGRPPLLLALASAASRDGNAAMALCDIFSACRVAGRQDVVDAAMAPLMECRHSGGLKDNEKYTSFFERIFGDGSGSGRPGALIVAHRFQLLGLMPDGEAIRGTHSRRRAQKWALCQQRGEDWGRGRPYGARGENTLEGPAARLMQRLHLERQWADSDSGHFAAIPAVPDALPKATPGASVQRWFRSLRAS
jgi:hypothetical protein